MNIKIHDDIERDFKCAVIQKYGTLRGNLENDVNIALCLLMRCEKEGRQLDAIQQIKEYIEELK